MFFFNIWCCLINTKKNPKIWLFENFEMTSGCQKHKAEQHCFVYWVNCLKKRYFRGWISIFIHPTKQCTVQCWTFNWSMENKLMCFLKQFTTIWNSMTIIVHSVQSRHVQYHAYMFITLHFLLCILLYLHLKICICLASWMLVFFNENISDA